MTACSMGWQLAEKKIQHGVWSKERSLGGMLLVERISAGPRPWTRTNGGTSTVRTERERELGRIGCLLYYVVVLCTVS